MQFSLPTLLVALVCGQAPQPSYQTANFVVEADTAPMAQAVAESAERYRKDFGRLWLEKELPDWSFPCTIQVAIDLNRTMGRTDVSFADGKVVAQSITISGPLARFEWSVAS